MNATLNSVIESVRSSMRASGQNIGAAVVQLTQESEFRAAGHLIAIWERQEALMADFENAVEQMEFQQLTQRRKGRKDREGRAA